VAAILMFVAQAFFALGVILAAWGALTLIVLPGMKGVSALAASSREVGGRKRALTIVTVVAAAVVALFVIPVPLWSCAEGVIWLPEQSYVRAGTDGFVHRILATPGTVVHRGDPLIECEDPILPARARVSEFALAGLKARYTALQYADRVQAEIAKEEMTTFAADVARANERRDAL